MLRVISTITLAAISVALPVSGRAQDRPAPPAAVSAPAPAPTPVPRNPALPPPDEQASAALSASPRHGEWADVKVPGSTTSIRTWVVYPERKDKAGVVIVIHEVYGLTDWIRAVADQLAREGFIAVAPDLVSGLGPGGGGTESVSTRDDVVKLVRAVAVDEATRRLDAVRQYALALPAANGRSATIGFCWGGARSFGYATTQPALNGAVVYYGSSPETADLARITGPVQGHYGGDDARVNATIPPAEAEMQRLRKSFEPHIYEGAGHGFLRAQTGRDGANYKATQAAWPRTIAFLKGALK